MSSRNWRAYVAIGGFLTILFAVSFGLAQEPLPKEPEPVAEELAERNLQTQQWVAYAAIAQAVLTLIAIFLIWRTLLATKDAVKEAARASEAAVNTVADMQRAERAYVTISHKPPGLDLQFADGHAKVVIEVKNFGRTPATVTAVHLELQRFEDENPPPDQPVYCPDKLHSKSGSFLVTNGSFFRGQILPIPGGDKRGDLWLFGYVDYVDVFDQRHRGGYARVYTPGSDDPSIPAEERNNLVFVSEPDWNYDRPLG